MGVFPQTRWLAVLAFGAVLCSPWGEARAQRWEVGTATGYGESLALDGETPKRAHVPAMILEAHRLFSGGVTLGVEATAPLVPVLPWGELSAGAKVGAVVALGEPSVLDGEGMSFDAALELRGSLSGGWTYVYSDLSEGYIHLSEDTVEFDGPYARLRVGPQWHLRPRTPSPPYSLVVGMRLGAGAVRADYHVPSRPADWRIGVDATLTTGLRW